MTPEQKAWIDGADYESLLRRWRCSPVGDAIFQGEAGDYYEKVMAAKRDMNPLAAVHASKRIGWGPNDDR